MRCGPCRDRAIPRSYRMMEGFGVHTFRLVNADGETTLVKFHWKPAARRALPGVGGVADARRHRPRLPPPRSLRRHRGRRLPRVGPRRADLPGHRGPDVRGHRPARPDQDRARGAGAGPARRDADARPNPTNFFAETEQVAFHTGHLVPGIDVTDDPLLQARIFSYLDTQLTRLGGPNFDQIPINRPHAPVNDNSATGSTSRRSTPGARPTCRTRSAAAARFSRVDGGVRRRPAAGRRARRSGSAPASFDDHFSQATLFWNSMTPRRAGPHRRRVLVRAGQVLRPASRSGSSSPWPTSTPSCAPGSPPGLGLPAPAGKPAHDAPRPPALSPDPGRCPARSPAGSSGSSWTRMPIWPGSPRCARSCWEPGVLPLPLIALRGGESWGEGLVAPSGTLADCPLHRVRRRRRGGRRAQGRRHQARACCCRRRSGTCKAVGGLGRRRGRAPRRPASTPAAPGVLTGKKSNAKAGRARSSPRSGCTGPGTAHPLVRASMVPPTV